MLCIHANRDSNKILGFTFGTEPNACTHVSKVIDSMYSKLWTLRFLKKSGMSRDNLLSIYKQMLRASAEYGSVVYHSLIPDYMSEKLESVQKQAMKIIFGWDINYAELIREGVVESLASRRENCILKFALKASESPRFGTQWFTKNPDIPIELRAGVRNTYLEKRSRTERGRNNPLNYMTRRLNEHLSHI